MAVVRRARRLERAVLLAATLTACVTVVERMPCRADPSEQYPQYRVKRTGGWRATSRTEESFRATGTGARSIS